MHTHNLDFWKHAHDFELHDRASERKVQWVVALTLVTMVVEITAGMFFGSMALLADGWHMGTHAAALGITALAYYFARKHAKDRRFTFGTGKIGVLGGFTSAIVLTVVAMLMAVESIERLFQPRPIHFDEALMVATLGLLVNIVSAWLLQNPHEHHSTPEHNHHSHGHSDHNMRSAYLHVLADALTSVLAIAALTVGKFWHWVWLDAAMGIVGAVIITHWAQGLLRATGAILLDRDADRDLRERIRQLIEADADNRIVDLHLWKISANQLAVVVSVVTHAPRPPEHYKQLLHEVDELAHITVEIFHCDTPPCIPIKRIDSGKKKFES
ncbi:MAG: cation transporter [Desulfatitalea sp. BRH_c12]|nr:MAG: cation transporter [Desulfatitalea sp. BRH_c12]